MSPSRLWLAAVLATAVNVPAYADLRVLPTGEQPKDARLQPLKDLNGYFPFTPPATAEEWRKRFNHLRGQIRLALGIVPTPTRTPLNAVIHGRVDREEYTVEKVYFESMPGLFVTGNLYRPKNVTGRVPAVLAPHGHWPDGRFMEESDSAVKKEISSGAEKFENAARSPLQARCVQLARMGCIVFHYDMLGYADSQQISFDLAHKFAKQRPEMNTPTNWGLYSPQAESYSQNVMGLQTWNSMRAHDFLDSLPDVDPERVAITGASGGGTQTMLHAALDRRVAAAFPAVMVSTAMQGGCTCENASMLRIGTGNIEFAGVFAPKPMAMTAANDWTEELETKGFPELKRLWTTLGAPENVSLTSLTQFPHNYNAPSRAAMYAWFNKHLGLNLPAERMEERDFQRLSREELSVWNSDHPAPEGGLEFERKLLKWWRDDSDRRVQRMKPHEVRRAVEYICGTSWEETREVRFEKRATQQVGGFAASKGLLHNSSHGASLPLVHLAAENPTGAAVLWLDERGKAGLFEADDRIHPEALALLRAGVDVVGVDLLHQGEFLTTAEPLRKTPRVKNPREAAAYTFGYNYTLFAQRTRDVLSALRYLTGVVKRPESAGLVAVGSTGPIAVAARALIPEGHGPAALEQGDFRFIQVSDLQDPNFQPAIAKFGDLPGLLAIGSPERTRLVGSSDAKGRVQTLPNGGAAVEWLKEELQRTITP